MRKFFETTLIFAFLTCLTVFAAPPSAGAGKGRLFPMLGDGDEIRCAGEYAGHIQGLATDGETIYWSFTSAVVRTDLNGKVLAKHPLAVHGGDPCFAGGKLYVPLGTNFSLEPGKKEKKHKAGKNKKPAADNFVLVLDPDLKPLRTIPLVGFKYGAGGIACRNGRFYIVGGRPAGRPGNTIHEYGADFKPLRRIEIDFNSSSGIQTINFTPAGRCLLGCYGAGGMAYRGGNFFIVGGRPDGKPGNTIYEYDGNFKLLRRHEVNFNSLRGIQTINFTPEGKCLIGCYGVGDFTTELDGKWRVARRPRPNTAVGAIPLGGELCLVARTLPAADGRTRAMAKVYRLKSAFAPAK